MTIQALFFGGIGTLLETSELQREAFNAAFREAGLDWHWSIDEYREMLENAIVSPADFASFDRDDDPDAVLKAACS